MKLVTSTFVHPGRVTDLTVKSIYKILVTWLPIFLGDWGPRVTDLNGKMGTPHETDTTTLIYTELIHIVNVQYLVLVSKLLSISIVILR